MSQKVIPKIIHFCWFGGGEKSKDVLEYIKTWQQLSPDYKIMEWHEKTYSIENSIPYVKEAYSSKKWAFVSDYVRLYALYNYGGIYLDTDVQILKSFDDLLKNEVFFGFESKDYLCTAVMGACSKHWFVKEFLDSYKERHFIKEDGTLDTVTTNVVVLTKLLCQHGLVLNGKVQNISEIKIYPQKYFSDNSLINLFNKYKKSSYAYHHYSASWYESTTKKGFLKKIRHYILGKARNLIGTEKLYRVRHKE